MKPVISMELFAMQIIIEERNEFGNQRFYPICDKAKAFCSLMGSTTLTDHKLRTIKRNLGYEIVLKQKELSF